VRRLTDNRSIFSAYRTLDIASAVVKKPDPSWLLLFTGVDCISSMSRASALVGSTSQSTNDEALLIISIDASASMIRYPTFLAIAVMTATAAPAQGYYRWGVFRERSLIEIPVDQRRCRIQEISPGEINYDEILARRTTRPEAILDYRYLVSRGLCAP
jgi:hypothetical protein